MKNVICISLGGSVIHNGNSYNTGFLRRFSNLIKDYKDKKFVIVTGGGSVSRSIISQAKEITGNNYVLDSLAISITRINALVVSELFEGCSYVESIKDAIAALERSKIVVMGGLMPGITTDTVSVLACEALRGKLLINVSSNGFIYSNSPSSKNAKKLFNTTYDLLIERADKADMRQPGTNFIFDSIASRLAKRSGIVLKFVNADIEEIRKAIEEKRHNGTTVR
ncbi:MAG: UMP kinase [Candidatus Micrarchaeia archaeon]